MKKYNQCFGNRLFPIVLLTIACLFLLASLALGGDDEKATPPKDSDQKVLDAKTEATSRYLPVVFTSHDDHVDFGIACKKCHHELASDDQKPKKCSLCHNQPGAPVNLAKAMHGSCLACHKQNRKTDETSTAPVYCLDCHKERK